MAHREIDTSPKPDSIRIFDSDFLEFFTHIHPAVIVVFWSPLIVLLLADSIINVPVGISLWHVPLGVLLGIFLWTLAEYLLHRYVFHYEPQTPRQEKIFFMFHGVHHYQPQDKTRLVMPLPVSVPLGLLFYGAFYLIFATLLGGPHWLHPAVAGFMSGYLFYDLTHYATHHWPIRNKVFLALKRHHMKHHYKEPDALFGVSNTFWDHVFGTMVEKPVLSTVESRADSD